MPQLFAKPDRFGAKLRVMTEFPPQASSGGRSVSGPDRSGKTPPGVWMVVAMAALFAMAGLGTGIFIALKTILEKSDHSAAAVASGVQRSPEVPSGAKAAQRPVSVVEDNTSPPPVVANPVEQDAMRQEVLNRIDLMRSLSQADKDKLYAQVERAREFRKVAIIPFSKSGTTPSGAQIEALTRRLKEPEMQKLVGDPTVLLVMVGFADLQGEESKNLEVSRARAESVVKALREKSDVINVMHSVGMGGQNLFDQANLEKNRLVEVWAVQP
jgi:outer membrane protein OmpA-like peptidoglycan-associated protein